MKTVLPKYLLDNLAVTDLVNFGNEPGSDTEEKVKEVIVEKIVEVYPDPVDTEDAEAQTDPMPAPVPIPIVVPKVEIHKPKTPERKPVPITITEIVYKKQGTANKASETDPSLLDNYIQQRNPNISIKMANQHIDKVVGDEMSKTIATLNDFVSKIQMA